MTAPELAQYAPLATQLGAGAAAGALAGAVFFSALWWNVKLIDRGQTLLAGLLFVLRLCALALALYALARFGAAALLAGAAGLLVARRYVLRRFGTPP
jgi:F1F0 ATPase subunit 2